MRRNRTQHHLTQALATCLTAGALVLGLGALPAQAESRTVTDARGDVRTFTTSFDEEEEEIDDQPSTTSDGDILSATYTHTRRRIGLSVSYAELEPGHESAGWVFVLRGSNGQRRELSLETTGTRRATAEMVRSSSYRQVCRGNIRRTVDHAAGRLDVSFPRTCLESPRSFRVGHVSYWTESSESEETQTFFYDDPQQVGGSPEQAGSRFSPWVRRG